MNQHLLLPITVSVLALALLDPFKIFMTNGVAWTLVAGLLITTSSYGLFVFTERANDERELRIRAFADRASCMVGMLMLVITISYHLYTNGHVYPEVIFILVAMVTTKSITHWYACNHH